jgi:hypothetical protein
MGLFFTYNTYRYMVNLSRFKDHYKVSAFQGSVGMYVFISEDELGRSDMRDIIVKRVREYYPTGRIWFGITPPTDAVVITSVMKRNMENWRSELYEKVNPKKID